MTGYPLPKNWGLAISGDILDIRDGTHDTPKYVESSNHPLVTSKNLKSGVVDLTNTKYISDDDFTEISKRSKVDIGDVLFAMIGTIGNPVIVKAEPAFAIKNIGLFKNPNKIINSHYLKYFLDSYTFISQLEKRQLLKGTTQKFIPLGHLRCIHLPLAPHPEQSAIADRIEQLFSELDNGIDNLKTAQNKLEVYRQAVLKKAFEGKLTKEWREQQFELPTAAELLEKIELERKIHYEKQLTIWEEEIEAWELDGRKGKKPPSVKNPKEIKDLSEDQIKVLFKIPRGFIWKKIGHITLNTEYGSSAKSLKVGKVPVLRMGNIQNGKFDWSDLVFSNDTIEIEKYELENDDVLFNRTNSPELVGKTAIYKGEYAAIFAGYLIRVNQIRSLCRAEYLNYYLNSHSAKVHGNTVKTDGVNQSNINGEKLKNYPFPICSLAEQTQIVQEIESRLSVCDKLSETIKEQLQKAEALRQSILKKAFEGRLLSEAEIEACKQESDWEPTEQLLARIKAEREQAQEAKPKAKSPRKASKKKKAS